MVISLIFLLEILNELIFALERIFIFDLKSILSRLLITLNIPNFFGYKP